MVDRGATFVISDKDKIATIIVTVWTTDNRERWPVLPGFEKAVTMVLGRNSVGTNRLGNSYFFPRLS